MSLPEEIRARVEAELEESLKQALSCGRGFGELDEVLSEAAERVGRLAYELLAQSASKAEADFPPSGVSRLRTRADKQPGAKASARRNRGGRRKV